ncbi:hypothetical protein [Priestia megaterium]|uniref:hypothetical protein n=1 Tax=Priestia megaterium TaxID=1404 RepID=UPI0028778B84|nr:hypothetical protein [Priestia megaterium]
MTTAVTQDKDFLVKILVDNLKWSHGSLNSFKLEELQQLYEYILDGYKIFKAKSHEQSFTISLTIPKKVSDMMGLEYGDLFRVKGNADKRQVILYKEEKGRLKLGANRKIIFPVLVAQKKLLKGNDDTMILVKNERIILKSFTYMQ